MARITITNSQGIIYEQINTDEWNLEKPLARVALLQEILDWVDTADKSEQTEEE